MSSRARLMVRSMVQAMVIAMVLAGGGAARAQSNNSYARMLDTTRTLQKNFFDDMNRVNKQRSQSEKSVRGGPPATSSQRPTAHMPLAMTDFRPVYAGHPVVRQFVDGLPPAARATMEQAIAGVWGAMEAKTRPNNLAASLGVSVAVATLLVAGTDQDDAALAEQVARANDVLATSTLWLGMQPAGKQTLSDSLLLSASVMLVYAEIGKTDPTMKQASQRARASAVA